VQGGPEAAAFQVAGLIIAGHLGKQVNQCHKGIAESGACDDSVNAAFYHSNFAVT